MSPPDRSAAQPPPTQTRYEDLVDAAIKLFSEHGYERATVRMIADELGVKSGSLYSHIKSKQDVLRTIVLDCAESLLVAERDVMDEARSPEERLRAMARTHLRMLEERRAEVTIYFDEWQKLDDESRARIVALRRDYERLLQGVIEEGIERGEFGPVDVRGAVLVLVSSLNWTYKWYDPSGPLGPEEIADVFVDVVLGGLRRRD